MVGRASAMRKSVRPTIGALADLVLGQEDFTRVAANGGGATGAGTMSSPTAVDVVNGRLYIADSGNNRVVVYDGVPASSGAVADAVLGQPDLTSRTPGSVVADVGTLAGPVQVVDDGDQLYVCDRDLARVVAYPLSATGEVLAPRLAFPLGIVTLAGPNGLAVERTNLFTSRLYVASTNANLVDVIDSVSRLSTH